LLLHGNNGYGNAPLKVHMYIASVVIADR